MSMTTTSGSAPVEFGYGIRAVSDILAYPNEAPRGGKWPASDSAIASAGNHGDETSDSHGNDQEAYMSDASVDEITAADRIESRSDRIQKRCELRDKYLWLEPQKGGKVRWRCKLCEYGCPEDWKPLWTSVLEHVRARHLRKGRKPFVCQSCGQAFACLKGLQHHESIVHKGGLDASCAQDFLSNADYREHYRRSHLRCFISCPVCAKPFRTKVWLDRHVSASHPDYKDADRVVIVIPDGDEDDQVKRHVPSSSEGVLGATNTHELAAVTPGLAALSMQTSQPSAVSSRGTFSPEPFHIGEEIPSLREPRCT
ncbi:hypothetical protein F4778DRAFT_776715 [Xylariomycetidae sp. FL2044]|nr:hypothetical protein F4778DRAFT_776715 [Xylariomycetidae sp. FL2044]